MINLNRQVAQPAVFKHLLIALLGVATLLSAGCTSERDENDGELINALVLPTDVVLNLACENVGIADETCVLDDPENPYATTTIIEFDVNNPDAANKFELYNAIPAGPTGAKARFYLWATALARRQSGENQYYTALHLHELFDANSNVLSEDELVREQALKAYRSVLDNFFGSVTVFKCFTCGFPPGEEPENAVPLNERVADHLFRKASTDFVVPGGLRQLVPPPDSLVLDLFVEWGYSYQPCTDLPDCSNGVVTVGEF
jgi:hypothetical protein